MRRRGRFRGLGCSEAVGGRSVLGFRFWVFGFGFWVLGWGLGVGGLGVGGLGFRNSHNPKTQTENHKPKTENRKPKTAGSCLTRTRAANGEPLLLRRPFDVYET